MMNNFEPRIKNETPIKLKYMTSRMSNSNPLLKERGNSTCRISNIYLRNSYD